MGGGVRSSARLSGGADRSVPRAAAARSAAVDAAARAAAAERRARAAERAREVEDSPRVLRDKCRRLARAVRDAKHLVVYTGAGISTAADIPDYRGPRGVWTRLQRGETVGRVEVSRARPTFTHMALTALWARGALKFVVSQNCDGLHVRAGLPRRALAELHGDMFAERCAACRRVYLRAFDTTERTARHAHGTRRLCHACGRELRDTIVHFGERGCAAWPLNWAGALRHAAAADVVLCLGSSLKVLRRYPRLWRMQRAPRARPALYIVNLQWTPKDAVAALKINARCDTVMAAVARRLRLRVPRYSARRDPLLAHAVPLAPLEQHTARRPPLPPPPPLDSDSEACYSLSSASCSSSSSDGDSSDSESRLPLGRLAARLRASAAPRAPPLPPVLPNLPGDHLRSFQVSLRSCQATILLRAEHAPSAPPPSPHVPYGAAAPASSHVSPSPTLQYLVPMSPPAEARAPTSDLRSFRMQRLTRPAPKNGIDVLLTNGHRSPLATNSYFNAATHSADLVKEEENDSCGSDAWGRGSKLRQLLELKCYDEDATSDVPSGLGWRTGSVVKTESSGDRTCKVQLPVADGRGPRNIKSENRGTCRSLVPYTSPSQASGALRDKQEMSEVEAAAAAIIRRAVLVCRASLYPGLHTILAAGGEHERARRAWCAWCAQRFGARRCLWYGAPPDARAPRAARRVRDRAALCACCPDRAPPPPHPHPHPPLPDDAGWYGKGYRKGRRRRR